jgi:glycosyl transferase family 25
MFKQTGMVPARVSAIDGGALVLPVAEFSELRYRWFHGREGNIYEIGCYLSHLKALRTFLASEADFGLICEDDLSFDGTMQEVLAAGIRSADDWNILRLSGLSNGRTMRVKELCGGHALCVNMGRMKGAGAYVVDRMAARVFTQKLLPMWLPYDHAFDREWRFGLTGASVQPFPISQTSGRFRSGIQRNSGRKLPEHRRLLGAYPYQVCNELSRWMVRFTNWALLRTKHCARKFADRNLQEAGIAAVVEEQPIL